MKLIALIIISFSFNFSTANAQNEEVLEKGKKVFLRCKMCHGLEATSSVKGGPTLEGMFGKQAGFNNNYREYSKALIESEIIWTKESLDQWLQNPTGFLPGNKMVFSKVNKKNDRDNLIAYLKEMTK